MNTTIHVEELDDRAMAPAFSEDALALQFAERHRRDHQYVAALGRWFIFDGKVWREDDTRKVFSEARDVCREAAAATNRKAEAKAIASAKTRAAVVSLAGEDRRLAATVDQWDRDPWLINTPGGVVDLRTGVTRTARSDDYMTKITAAAPYARCPTPLWDEFLKKLSGDKEDIPAFLRRWSGYAATGSTREQKFAFLFGSGANGKSVFINTVAGVLGDYHKSAPIETFTASKTEQHPTDLAMLRGARLVTATETEEGRGWAESKIKRITGGDPIQARYMRQDFFEYVPQFKLTIAGNNKPWLHSVDVAIRRRLLLVPFDVTIPAAERDENLAEKLKEEWPGIMAWIVKGAMEWQQREGLAPPKAVTDATDSYFEDEDVLQTWVNERCDTDDPQAMTLSNELYNSWVGWAANRNEYVISNKKFTQRLDGLGFRRERQRDGAMWKGIKLRGNAGSEPF